MNEDERVRLISLYGICRVCGAPRRSHKSVDTDWTGHTRTWTSSVRLTSIRVVCTADASHSQEPPPIERGG